MLKLIFHKRGGFPVPAVLLSLCLFFLLAQPVAAEAYDIQDYQVQMKVGSDRASRVQETVDLNFQEDRQGIIRKLPHNNSIEDFTVGEISAGSDPFTLEENDYETNVRIGKAGTYISGEKEYNIGFTRSYYRDNDSQADWFYTDLIPADWDADIAAAEITVTFPQAPTDYTLHFGPEKASGGADDLSVTVKNNVMTIKNLRAISNGEAITLMAEFPEGTFAQAPEKVYPYVVSDYQAQAQLNSEGNLHVREAFSVRFQAAVNSFGYDFDFKEKVNGNAIYLKNLVISEGKGDAFSNSVLFYPPAEGDSGAYVLEYDLIFPPDANEGKDIFLYEFPGVWKCPVENAIATITLPAQPTGHQARFWLEGDPILESGEVTTALNGNTITFTGKTALAERQTIGFQLDFPDGTFVKSVTPPEIIGIVGAVIAFFLTLFLYFRFGRDEAVAPVVEFYPPDGMNPAEVGYVIDGSADSIDATALVFYWASQGYLEIEAQKKSFVLHRKGSLTPNHREYERHAFNALWDLGDGESVKSAELEGKFFTEVIAIKSGIRRTFRKGRKLQDTRASAFSWLSMILGILVLPCLPMAAVYVNGGGWNGGLLAYGIALLIFAVLGTFVHWLTFRLNRRWYKTSGGHRVAGVVLLVLGLLVLFFLLGIAFSHFWHLRPYTAWICLTGGFFATVISVFITKRSAYGQRILERVVGFRDFLQDAEKEKLEALLEENPSYFYDILPYAQVLGVTKLWGEKFRDLTVAPPNWYHQEYDDFSTMVFVASYMNLAGNLRHSAITPPSNDGGGDGGFGGGGFGGGGFSSGGFSGGGGGGGGSSW